MLAFNSFTWLSRYRRFASHRNLLYIYYCLSSLAFRYSNTNLPQRFVSSTESAPMSFVNTLKCLLCSLFTRQRTTEASFFFLRTLSEYTLALVGHANNEYSLVLPLIWCYISHCHDWGNVFVCVHCVLCSLNVKVRVESVNAESYWHGPDLTPSN